MSVTLFIIFPLNIKAPKMRIIYAVSALAIFDAASLVMAFPAAAMMQLRQSKATEGLLYWALQYCHQVSVIEPKSLRRKIIKTLKECRYPEIFEG